MADYSQSGSGCRCRHWFEIAASHPPLAITVGGERSGVPCSRKGSLRLWSKCRLIVNSCGTWLSRLKERTVANVFVHPVLGVFGHAGIACSAE